MVITIVINEAMNEHGRVIAYAVGDIRGDVSFRESERLKLPELHTKLAAMIEDHLNYKV